MIAIKQGTPSITIVDLDRLFITEHGMGQLAMMKRLLWRWQQCYDGNKALFIKEVIVLFKSHMIFFVGKCQSAAGFDNRFRFERLLMAGDSGTPSFRIWYVSCHYGGCG